MTDEVELTLTLYLPKGSEAIVTIRKDEDGVVWIYNDGEELMQAQVNINLKRKPHGH